MTKLVHYTVCVLLWLGRALSCPDDCFCTNVVVDNEVGTDVDCSYASLARLPTMPQGTLLLDFSNNELQVIPPSIKLLPKLRELDLSSNRFGYDNDEGLPDDIFSTLVYLKVLDLSDNFLSILSSNTFKGLVQLERLDLSGNEIMHLPLGMLQLLPNTAVVCLGGNHWNCNMCHFHEILEWYLSADRNHTMDVCNGEVPSCFSPSKRRFTEISLEEIPECDEEKLITTEPSIVTVDSLQSSASANTHTTTASTTTTSPEFCNNSGKASFQMRKLGSWSWFLLIIAFLAPKVATRQAFKSSLLLSS